MKKKLFWEIVKTLKKYIFSIYLALIITISFGIAFISTLQLYFQFERDEINNQGLPIAYIAKVEPGQSDSVSEQITKEIGAIDGIVSLRSRFYPFPPGKATLLKRSNGKKCGKLIYRQSSMQRRN